MKRLLGSVSLGALALCTMESLAVGQGTMAPMRPVQMPQQMPQMQQQLPPAATAAPQQLGAQYGPNQVYPGYQSGMGGMPGGSGIPGLGGTPGMGGGGFPGLGGGIPGMG